MRILYLLFISLITVTACRTTSGEAEIPLAPSTSLEVDSINLANNARLQTKVHIHWFGSSKNGYITGYKVHWSYKPLAHAADTFSRITTIVSRTDSNFRFSITPTDSTVFLYVQAIDNHNQGDPNPPHIRIPLRNTPPRLNITRSAMPQTDTVFQVLTIPWFGADDDGDDTWDSVEVRVNQGAWITIKKTNTLLTLVAENPAQIGTGNALLYGGNVPTQLTIGTGVSAVAKKLPGWNTGGLNTVYMRARDNSHAYSKTDSSKVYFIPATRSDLLVLNGNLNIRNKQGDPNAFDVFLPAISSAYPAGYDLVDLERSGGQYQPYYPTPYIQLLTGLYKKVVFFGQNKKSNNRRDTTVLLLDSYAPALSYYKRNGGKLFVISRLLIKAEALPSQSNFYSLVPVANLLQQGNPDLRMVQGDSLTGKPGTGYPNLIFTPTSLLSGLDVFDISGNGEPIYGPSHYDISGNGTPYTGSFTMGLRQRDDNGKVNFVYIAADLQLFNKYNRITSLFNKVLNDEFNR